MNQSKQLYYIANASSPHVRAWIEYIEELNLNYHIYSIHENTLFPPANVTVKFNKISKRIPGGKLLSYILLGLWLRFKIKNNITIHAHNTSGYGLSAYLSNKKYIVTTYGSEIFKSESLSYLYKYLIVKILKKSYKITSSSYSMKNYLVRRLCVDPEKVYSFSLGVSSYFLYSKTSRKSIREKLSINQTSTVWIYNRRITPLYNTLDVIKAFKNFAEHDSSMQLILLAGNYEKNYLEVVEKEIIGHYNIHLIKGLLSLEEMSDYLSASDISISTPKSDQLSSSILESISCGCLPILSNLEAYKSIIDSCIPNVVIKYSDIQEALNRSNEIIKSEKGNLRLKIINKYSKSYWSRESVINNIKKIYDLE